MNAAPSEIAGSRLERLMRFVERDPKNTSLLADAAATAYEEGDLDTASQLLDRLAALGPLPGEAMNLAGLVAMGRRQFDEAARHFQALIDSGARSPAIRFNFACALAMTDAWQDALNLLDDATVAASPRAPALKIQAMHHLQKLDEALAAGEHLAKAYPDNQALMGALATLAMDAGQMTLAQVYARRAPNDPDGQAALGMLALDEQNTKSATAMFDNAIKAEPGNARAWIGKGLAQLAGGDANGGARALDKGAELFGDHLGSWIAAGWAYAVAGDRAAARARFERARTIDGTFSESYGGLAVLDVLAGSLEAAQRNTEIALRLDKNCFGGALAKSLLLDKSGQAQAAQKIRDMALNSPVGPNGKTIAQALAAFGTARRK